jgi:hypothetical protein
MISVECNRQCPMKSRILFSFDDFVGARGDRRRQGEAERLGDLD